VTKATQASSALAARYAAAYIDLAEQDKTLEKIEADLRDLAAMLESSDDLLAFTQSPLISVADQEAALTTLADKAGFQDLTKRFLATVAHNRRLAALPAIVQAAFSILAERRGEVAVEVRVAQDMDAKQKTALQETLAKALKADVGLDISVDPAILGGMVVSVGSVMVDDSVAGKLERLKSAMGKRSNMNSNSNQQSISEVG
jgi:F-type H+-transporting ATPase subunit delta